MQATTPVRAGFGRAVVTRPGLSRRPRALAGWGPHPAGGRPAAEDQQQQQRQQQRQQRQPRRRAGPPPARASGGDPPSTTTASLLAAAKAASRTDLYRGPLQVAVFLVVFMVFDAAWSGDWSRIGAISKETEAALKAVSGAVAAVHAASAAVAWRAAAGRGAPPLWPAAKALAVGVLAAAEAVWAAEEEGA